MADLTKEVKIVFSGESTALGSTINSVSSGLDEFGVQIGKATQPLANLFDSVVKIDAVLAGFAVGSLALAVTAAGDFGQSFAEISTLINKPKEELGEFRNEILNYALTSTASIEEITAAEYQIISATGEWEDQLKLLTQAEKLNVAGKGELAATTKLLATALNAYGLDAEHAADFSDTLFTTVKVGVTNLTELGESFGQLTGLAASANVPFDDLAAATGALTGTVGNTSIAVTQLKGILTAILGPGKAARDMAKQLEISFNAEALAAEGLEGFLKKVFDATGGNTEKMKVLFGRVEALNGALVLGADTSGKFAAAMKAMEERTNAVNIAYDKMADNLNLSNQRIINSLKVTLITAGTPLLDEWGDIASAIANVFAGVKVSFDEGAFDDLLTFIEGLGADIATELEGIAAALPDALAGVDFSDFTTSLQNLIDAGIDLLNQLFGDLDLTKAEDLEAAIQKVVDVLTTWVDFSSGIVSGIGPFLEQVTNLADKFFTLDSETAKSAGQVVGWGKAINVVSGIIPSITAPLKLLSGAIGLLGVTQIPAMVSGLGILGPAIGTAGSFLAPFVGLVGALTLVGPENSLSRWLKDNSTLFNSMSGYIDDTLLSFSGYTGKAAEARIESANVNVELGKLIGKFADVTSTAKDVPEELSLAVRIESDLTDFFMDIEQVSWNLDNLDDYQIAVPVGIEEGAVEKVESDWNVIKVIGEDGSIIEIKVESAKAVTDATAADEKIDKELKDKMVLVSLQGDIDIEIAKIKADAETLQTAFEWNAKLEIAQVEAASQDLQSIAGVVEEAWASTGDVIASALGALDVDLSAGRWLDIIRVIRREQEIREDLAESTIKLTDAQVLLIEARAKAIAAGKPLITITSEGLEPALDLVLRNIVEKAQFQANLEGINSLMGGIA